MSKAGALDLATGLGGKIDKSDVLSAVEKYSSSFSIHAWFDLSLSYLYCFVLNSAYLAWSLHLSPSLYWPRFDDTINHRASAWFDKYNGCACSHFLESDM